MSWKELYDISKINLPKNDVEDPDIFISDYLSASKVEPEHAIDVIINVCNDDHEEKIKEQWNENYIQYHFYPIHDYYGQELIKSAAEPVYEILSTCKNQNVLVHCHAGISRSVSCVIFYMMNKYKINFDRSIDIIGETRKCASPNYGFQDQLEKWFKNNMVN
jgi:protein-tyrosine phosphatase